MELIPSSCRVVVIAALLFLPVFTAPAIAEENRFLVSPIGEEELHAIAGREDLAQANVSNQTSNVSNNSVNGNSVTGIIQFDDQALQNLSGMSLINANTGNNVSMNSSIMVNIAIQP